MSATGKDALPTPETTVLQGRQYRIISTCYPPIDFFERHVPPELLGPLWELEAQTNPRLLDETGDLQRVADDDRVSGPGASIVMAAFSAAGQGRVFQRVGIPLRQGWPATG